MSETVGRVTFGETKPQIVTHTWAGKSEPHPPMLCECEDRRHKIEAGVAWIFCPWCGRRLKP
jgi:hypothetical protein